ncbi:metallophosphoesterase family protein [Sphaerotilus montanus]|uniref:Calcineurin-like phosphoesterase domain-containing protein n=1 Tax=Sphaerotilus montanus TaxID=522889 RepID=A0A7Y9R4M3_9BURK|nr:metallophosphoesterase [Sphaerotilus montanus]NYG35483.1 hypothetical protein [Sphaerotilus montanus]
MNAPRKAEGQAGEPADAGTASRVAAPGAIWLCGDVHGRFEHLIGAVLQPPQGQRPAAIVLLGDVQAARPLELELAAILPHTEVWFIHGNHDTDSDADHDHLFGSALAHRNLHGRVVEVAGVRIAGLGGVFRGQGSGLEPAESLAVRDRPGIHGMGRAGQPLARGLAPAAPQHDLPGGGAGAWSAAGRGACHARIAECASARVCGDRRVSPGPGGAAGVPWAPA